MKVFLVVPNVKGVLEKPSSPHGGTAYLASYLMKNGHEVQVVDMRFNYNFDYLEGKLKKFNPDVVGVTSTSYGSKIAYNTINKLKQSGYKVVVGGPHSSTVLKQILEETKADFSIKREGEITFNELLGNLDNPSIVKGIIWRKKGKENQDEIIENPDREAIHDLDSLPFPAFELFELDKYMDKKIPIVTSRGCPYRCVYCSINLTMGHKFRARSAKNVVDELEYWVKKGYTYFGFNDDCFTFDVQRAKDICDIIIERGLKIKWELRNGIRIDRLDEELLRKMKEAGCFYLAFGIESAVQDVLNKMKKGLRIETAREMVLLAEKLKIKHGGFFIIGLPGDNFKRFKESLNFALSLPFDEIRFYNAVPYPGTELFTWIKDNGKFIRTAEDYLNTADAWDSRPIFETKDFNVSERKKAFEIAEEYVMKYLMRQQFGLVFGYFGWLIWKPKITRNSIMPLGKKVFSKIRMIKKALS